MAYRIELAPSAESDLAQILEHLLTSYAEFGDRPTDAFDRATRRIRAIRAASDRLADFPLRATVRDDVLDGIRCITIDRVIYWLDVDEPAGTVLIRAIFLAGQDHVRHMLARLRDDDSSV